MMERGFRMITDPPTLSSSLQLTPDEEVRKMACIRGNSSPQASLGVLKRLIGARHELAQILGDRHYAEFVLKNSMASSSSVVMPFLQEMSKMVRPSADEVVASYFPLPQCIEGLKVLVQSLFGATFCCVPLAPGESWHPDVIKLSLHHPEEGEYPGCAHFSIKGGRRVSETGYQLPVVALVCNFSGSHNPFNVKLNHSELETLFHEFGHALHSLLSRTEYQQFSCTRVAFDFAETPSNLFEYYAWDYRVLRRCARHYSTGEVIPQKLVESMEGARNMFAATELQRQIFYAMIDQTLVVGQPTPLRDTSSIVADLKTQYTSWRHVEGTHWHVRFSHLLNYGAGYHSYLYAKCFAASIWQKVCKEDPLSLSTGEALRTKFLQHGGAREPADLLKGLVGDGVLRYCNGGIVPDLTSLCDEMKLY